MIEANEAFAAQSMSLNNDVGWDTAKVNVSGGAIALGRPIGASGRAVLVTSCTECRMKTPGRGRPRFVSEVVEVSPWR